MKKKTKIILEGLFFLLLGATIIGYSLYDALDGTFYAGNRYSLGVTLHLDRSGTAYWYSVGWNVFLGSLGVWMGLSQMIKGLKIYDPWVD